MYDRYTKNIEHHMHNLYYFETMLRLIIILWLSKWLFTDKV